MSRAAQVFEESGLTRRTATMNSEQVARALADYYSLTGDLDPIPTEKDSTFRLVTPDQTPYLVKVSPPEEPIPVVLSQTDVIDWVESKAPDIPVQTVQRTFTGANHQPLADNDGTFLGVLRVFRFIPGTILADADPSPAQYRQLGAALGHLDNALKGFEHEGIERPLVWNLSGFMQFEELVAREPDRHNAELAQHIFDLYRARIEPMLPELRSQVIHGDLSIFNAVVDPESAEFVTGILDFGDVQRGPVIFDPAVLLANHLLPAPRDPWEVARPLFAGYTSAHPLTDDEIALLVVATLARLVLRALVTNVRVELVPEREEYLREHSRGDWEALHNAWATGVEVATRSLLDAAAAQQLN